MKLKMFFFLSFIKSAAQPELTLFPKHHQAVPSLLELSWDRRGGGGGGGGELFPQQAAFICIESGSNDQFH